MPSIAFMSSGVSSKSNTWKEGRIILISAPRSWPYPGDWRTFQMDADKKRGQGSCVCPSWTRNDPCEGYPLGALYPQPHSSSPACSLWSASCCNSWPEPQPHVAFGSEGQQELEFACALGQWQRELGPPRDKRGLGPTGKEIQKSWGGETEWSVYEEVSQTDQYLYSRPALLKLWSMGQQHLHHLGSCQKHKSHGLAEDKLNQNLNCVTSHSVFTKICRWFGRIIELRPGLLNAWILFLFYFSVVVFFSNQSSKVKTMV